MGSQDIKARMCSDRMYCNVAGNLVEYDDPVKLMKKEDSLFGQLVKEYWSHFQSADQSH